MAFPGFLEHLLGAQRCVGGSRLASATLPMERQPARLSMGLGGGRNPGRSALRSGGVRI